MHQYCLWSLTLLTILCHHVFSLGPGANSIIALKEPPLCYDDIGSFPEPSALDCKFAALLMTSDPDSDKEEIFGSYFPATRLVPLYWSHKSCLIFLQSEDASKTDSFALSSMVPALAKVQSKCMNQKPPGEKFGGYAPVGNNQGFYVGIQYNPENVRPQTWLSINCLW